MGSCRSTTAAAVLVAAVALTGCAAATGTPPAAAGSHPSPDGVGRTAGENAVRHVGALFHAGGGDHFCSGTLVDAGGADVVVTAAHCVAPVTGRPAADDLEFAPAYRDGTAPYGRWPATRVVVDPRWTASSDPDLDVAFLRLAPQGTGRLTDRIGADRIDFGPAPTGTVRLTGYPDGRDDPITCVGTSSRQSSSQLRVPCTGYSSGTSGSPWLADWTPATRTGTVVGVIGGYQSGGDTDDVSYSPYFGSGIEHLYQQAVAGS